MADVPVTAYRETIARRFGGVLTHGKHTPDGKACALEAESVARGLPWSDHPDRLPDLRSLNDARWSNDTTRTQHLIPVVEALWDWATWSEARRVRWAQYVTSHTIRDLVSRVVPEPHATRCREATRFHAADAAAAAYAAARAAAAARVYAAAYAADAAADADAARAAAYAAYAAADAADAAAYAADAAADADAARVAATADTILIHVCRIWIDAVAASEEA